MAPKSGQEGETVARNRRARHDYFIDDTLEAGVILTGSEVKSLRAGRASLNESYAGPMEGELYLFNAHIPEYRPANQFNHAPRRPRKLLVRRKQLNELLGASQRRGVTLVPLAIYFNKRGLAKVAIGLARGKKQHDKRETVKQRDWQREKQRLLREKG
ncbi:MAG: SsrA-binding protein SmpB [Pseudomonadota bacterium]